jgi:hypothetical protein
MADLKIANADLLEPLVDGGAFGTAAAGTIYNGLVTPTDWTVTYDAAARQFTAVVGAATLVNVGGAQCSVAADTYTPDAHADTSGVWYLKCTSAGALAVANSFDFLTEAIIGYAYYNATEGAGVPFNEKHPAVPGMSPLVHRYLHTHQGAVLVSGGTVSGITVDDPADASMQLDVDETVFDDESLRVTNAALVGGAGQYTVWFRSGAVADSEWFWTEDLDIPIARANDNPLWNNISGANAANTEIDANSRWVNYWFIATNSSDAKHKYISIMGQALHTSLADAQAENFLTGISWGTLPFKELVPLAKLTVRRAGAGSGNDFYIDEYQLLRGTQVSLTSVASPTLHNNLSGRSEAGAHPASAITDLPVTKCFGIADPGGYFSDVLEVVPLILEAEAELTITKLKLSCNANPDTELECDFMYANSWPALANPVRIDVADTTAGEYEATSFDAATIPAGKCVYLQFNAAPDAALKYVAGQLEYTR